MVEPNNKNVLMFPINIKGTDWVKESKEGEMGGGGINNATGNDLETL